MDNATFHKSNKSKALIEEKGAALLFLPPYSPDLNPIEQDFGALKKIRQYNHEKSIDDVIKYVSLIVQVTIVALFLFFRDVPGSEEINVVMIDVSYIPV
ncbi:MAG: transposase [Alphaproteobacteria bacterium]|nr:transposase [Alphaproteobacteria bacterium]